MILQPHAAENENSPPCFLGGLTWFSCYAILKPKRKNAASYGASYGLGQIDWGF